MNTTEYRQALRSLRDAIRRRRHDVTLERVADPVDQMTLVVERSREARLATIECRQLLEIDAALGRIDDGSFGSCEDCGEAISPGRLRAVPWVRRCIVCASIAEAMEKEYAESQSTAAE